MCWYKKVFSCWFVRRKSSEKAEQMNSRRGRRAASVNLG